MDMKDDSGVSVHTSKPDEAESSVIASSNPVVFQCSQCNAIAGDSTSWVSANKIMRTITLGSMNQVCNFLDSKRAQTSIYSCAPIMLVL